MKYFTVLDFFLPPNWCSVSVVLLNLLVAGIECHINRIDERMQFSHLISASHFRYQEQCDDYDLRASG
jgi:hypothetical protein